MSQPQLDPELFAPVVDESALFEKPINPVVVPRNATELAAQVAAVDESELSMPFTEKLARSSQQLNANGAHALLSDIALKERADRQESLRLYAEEQAKVGNTIGLQKAATMIQQERERTTTPTLVEGSRAVSNRALEGAAVQYAADRYRDFDQLDRAVEREGNLVSLRNIVGHESARLSSQTSLWDHVSHFFTAFLPFVHDYRVNRAISKETGIERYFDTEGAVNDFRQFFRGLGTQERQEVVRRLAEAQVGAIGENRAGNTELLRKLVELSKADANVDLIFNALAVTDVATLAKGLANLVRAGTPVKALYRVAGEKPAADLVLTDLTSGSGISGLNTPELIARSLAIGKNPMDTDPAAFTGLSAAVMGSLRSSFDELLANAKNRLVSSGLTEDEIKAGLADIRSKYSSDTNKAVHSVIFGEGDDLGQNMTVFWQGPDGRAFASRQAAEEWAKDQGLANYRVVPKNAADNVSLSAIDDADGARAFHGTRAEFDEFRLSEYGDTGWFTVDRKEAEGYAGGKGGRVIEATLRFKNPKRMSYEELLTLPLDGNKKLRADGFDGIVATGHGKIWYVPFDPKQIEVAKAHTLKSTPAGWDGMDMSSPQASGNVLSLSERNPSSINSLFDELAFASGGDPMAVQLADAWKSAAKQRRTNVDAGRLLHIIATQSPDDDFRFLAQHLLNTKNAKGLRWDKVPVELHWNIGAAGDYNVVKDQVRIALHHGASAETILHELMHAHSSQAITLVAGSKKLARTTLSKETFQAAERIVDLHKRMNDWWHRMTLKEREQWGGLAEEMGDVLADRGMREATRIPAELVTYGLTKNSVRQALSKIKLKDLGYDDATRSVWDEIWDAFKAILGIRANDTALAKLFNDYDALTKSVGENERRIMSRLVETNTISAREAAQLTQSSFLQSKNKSKPIGKALEKEIAKEERKLAKASDEERAAIVERIRELRSAEEGLHPKPVTPVSTEEWLVQERRVDPISNANVGKFSEEDIRSMPWLAIDPKHAASEFAVDQRLIGIHAEAKLRKDLVSHVQPFFDKLSRAGKAKVKAVLEEGDSVSNNGGVGKEFSYTELRGRGLSEDEAAAYFAARQVRMVSYHLRNAEMVRALKADGFREIELITTGEKHAGRMFATVEEAGSSLGRAVYDYSAGKVVLMDSDILAKAYAGGQKVVQFKQPVQFGGKHYYHAIVDDSTAKAREIVTALHYRPGEFSRIYTDQYFITVRKQVDVDGKSEEITQTVRTAASTREAQAYVEAHRAAINMLMKGDVPRNQLQGEVEKLIGKYQDPAAFIKSFDEGELSGYIGMDFHYTRNAEEFLNGSINEAMTNGRLFTSKRSEKLFSVERDRVNTKDVYESLEAEITNISRVSNISQWRETTIRRWMNTFGHMLPSRTGNDIADFIEAAGAKFSRGTQDAQFAERTHAYIMRQIGVRTQEERFYEGMTRTVTERLFTGNERIESVGAFLRTKKFIDFVRSVNFNFNLGMFNPAQLLVQANGAATAAILSPIHGVKAAMTFPLLRMALMSDNPDVWRRFAKMEKFKNLGLSDEGEFIEIVKAIRKSGLIDNVRSTALFNMEDGALNIFHGYPSRIGKSNTMFFNRGEEFSRVVSFDVARREGVEHR
jgi:hypothetical protein